MYGHLMMAGISGYLWKLFDGGLGMVGGASPVTAVLDAVTAYVWQYSIKFLLVMLPIALGFWLLVLVLYIKRKKDKKNRRK